MTGRRVRSGTRRVASVTDMRRVSLAMAQQLECSWAVVLHHSFCEEWVRAHAHELPNDIMECALAFARAAGINLGEIKC